MDTYPGDLLVGVFPLVFAVDAVLVQDAPPKSEDADDGEAGNTIERAGSTRSIFERFLDAMASTLVDPGTSNNRKASIRKSESSFASLMQLPRTDHDGYDDSSDEEDGNTSMAADSITGASASSTRSRFRVGIVSPNPLKSIPQSLSPRQQRPVHKSTAYASSLTEGEEFFERARVVSISPKHGFPPSKDPSGTGNRAVKLEQARSALAMNPTNANAMRLKRVMDNHPIDGILQSGWLEKHVHALPSVLLVVTSFQILDKEQQDLQDEHLLETVKHLRESLASKRECSIRLVCLADTPDGPTTPSKVDEWVSRTKKRCKLQGLTILSIPHDLEVGGPGPGMPTTGPMKQLHTEVRDASWTYYQSLGRRYKRKLGMLGHDHQPTLLPLAVRYCFKMAIFYEFLLKHQKAMRYFSDAYKHLLAYYRLLLGKSLVWNPPVTAPADINPQGDDGIEATFSGSRAASYDEPPPPTDEAGVEIALVDSDDPEMDYHDDEEEEEQYSVPLDIRKIFTEIDPPFDMANQCRALADWLNFKLIQGGLNSAAVSGVDQGILAASSQWRQHSQVFLKHDDPNVPNWRYWSFVTQQRHAISQLVERYPPNNNLTSLKGLARDEVMMRFSSWRNYMASAEAMLRLGVEVKRAIAEAGGTTTSGEAAKELLRGKFVGGLDSEGFVGELEEEGKRKHADLAFGMINRAIQRLEKSQAKEMNEDSVSSSSCRRTGARLYYLAGGILLGKGEHKDAIVHLEKAVNCAAGWKGLELVIRRMLIECYEKHVPSQDADNVPDAQGNAIASMILDSYFNSQMSSRNLRRALSNFSSLGGGKIMRWHRECIDESDSSLPFSFAVTFSGTTHVTAGDTATASVMLKSNLDYAVHINAVTLLSMAGKVTVPPNSLLSAQNANEGSDGGIIVQAKTSILFSTSIEVPKDLDKIETDEGGNGGEKEGTAGKGSFAKSARPRSAGLTSAAGARLIPEGRFEKEQQDRNSQWSVQFLGGKPLRCDGICLEFYPVYVEKSGASNVSLIELTIEKKRPTTAANIRRTPFEEDNYLASAWSRPNHLPLEKGPRCLRVLGPMPHMIVTNLTDSVTGGKAIEGTVNRILIKLQSGKSEICEDIKYKLSSSSMLLSMDGSTTHLNFDIGTEDAKKRDDIKNLRLPVMVSPNSNPVSSEVESLGYALPAGWSLVGSGEGSVPEQAPSISTLKMGEETYIYFHLFRPHCILPAVEGVDENGSRRSQEELEGASEQLCQTDFDVAISYKQARPKVTKGPGRRRRKPPAPDAAPADDNKEENADELDMVALDFTGCVMWTSPLVASYAQVAAEQRTPPSGTSHPFNSTNSASNTENDKASLGEGDDMIALIDGECVGVQCTLQGNDLPTDVDVEVSRVWFQELEGSESDENIPCNFTVVGKNGPVLFESSEKDLCRRLYKDRKLGIMLNAETRMKSGWKQGSVSTHVGIVCVDWAAVSLLVPEDARAMLDVESHGPLVLRDQSTIKFRGPACYVEDAPFDTKIATKPPSPQVGMPFEITYLLKNKSAIPQSVSVDLTEQEAVEPVVLVAGSVKSQLQLMPQESLTMTYSAVSTRAGSVALPNISLSSGRYNAWLVPTSESHIFVLP